MKGVAKKVSKWVKMINSVIISLLIIFVTTNINAIVKRIYYTFYNFDVQLKKRADMF